MASTAVSGPGVCGVKLVVLRRPGYPPGLGVAVRAQPRHRHVVLVHPAWVRRCAVAGPEVKPVELTPVGEPDIRGSIARVDDEQTAPGRPAMAPEPELAGLGVRQGRPEPSFGGRRFGGWLETGRPVERADLAGPMVNDSPCHRPVARQEVKGAGRIRQSYWPGRGMPIKTIEAHGRTILCGEQGRVAAAR